MYYLKASLAFIFFGIFTANAQYTEIISPNRPGESQGAYAVGKNVLQLEAGGYYDRKNHNLLNSDTDIFGAQYEVRYGLLTEILELHFSGSFQNQVSNIPEKNITNFRSNTLGAKFLLFDPEIQVSKRKLNLYSWKANQRFNWRSLIPAVSAYAGANLLWWDNPYMFNDESAISPKAALITQHNWGRWVFIMNFVADKFTEDKLYRSYAGIFTLSHAITSEFAVFGEFQTNISDLYADEIVRGGAAYLFSKDFQIDISGLLTPSRWQVAAGVSYRFDFHVDSEYIKDTGPKLREKGYYKENQ